MPDSEAWDDCKRLTAVKNVYQRVFVSAQPVCIITSMAHEHNLQTWSELLRCIEHMALAFSSASLQLRKTALDLLVFGVSSPSMRPSKGTTRIQICFFSVLAPFELLVTSAACRLIKFWHDIPLGPTGLGPDENPAWAIWRRFRQRRPKGVFGV